MQTRSTIASSVDSTYPELLPNYAVSGHGASHRESQESFMKMVKMTSANDLEFEVILSPREAELLAVSLQHEFYHENELTDPFFTREQWLRVQQERSALLSCAEALFKKGLQNVSREESDGWLAQKNLMSNLCECTLHSSEDGQADQNFISTYSNLVQIQEPLNDDSGKGLAQFLLSHIIKKANLNMKIETVDAGSPITISYLLRLPSGCEGFCISDVYSGYCDFAVYTSYSAALRRLHYPSTKAKRLRSTGEVQSPQGNSVAAKTSTIAQAGIYTIGQFANNLPITERRSMASIIFFKDLTATVAVATIDPTKGTMENSLGQVTYEHVDIAYNLKLPDDMARFASTFISVLKHR